MDPSTNELSETDLAAIAANLAAATGGAAPAQALRLMGELAEAAVPGGAMGAAAAEAAAGQEDAASPVVAAFEAALALAPRDPLEGMLVAQMAAVHAAAMRCLARAAECGQYPKIEALYLREAARLLQLFQRQAETLDRRARRPGAPKAAVDAAGDPDAANEAPPDGQKVLERVLAELRERVAARERAEGGGGGNRDSGMPGGDPPAPGS